MNELEIYPQGTWYNSGTQQREPILHVRKPLSAGGNSNGGGSGRGSADGETIVAVACIILLCIIGVSLYFAIKYAIKGIKRLISCIRQRRAQREAERAKTAETHREELRRLVAPLEELAPVPDAPAASAPVADRLLPLKPKTEAELRAEAEDEWDRRLALQSS